jgi:hypothetical protein
MRFTDSSPFLGLPAGRMHFLTHIIVWNQSFESIWIIKLDQGFILRKLQNIAHNANPNPANITTNYVKNK